MLLGLSGCATLGWYGQAASGQLDILSKREDIAQLLADPDTDPVLAERLALALDIRAFAVAELGLPDSRSYTRYADLGREAAVWNVVATPRYALEPKTWCYPLVGCLAYRGFFDRDRADAVAAELSAQGMDAAVFAVPAYSTLGWFADPVLNTMLGRGEAWLAGLIFHELAHEQLFVRGETAFSEGYAVTVERVGVERWLSARGDAGALARWHKEQALQAEFTTELMAARERLGSIYGSGLPEPEAETARAAVFADLRARVSALDARAGDERFSRWASREINNAHLALAATYESAVAGFMRLLAACEEELACLHKRAAALGRADSATRQRFLSDTDRS
ncbi:aminopeptidase [Wenzhouxiangella limi]|uniref:aminopeptidase n=1 Tax=Wenzhouxiangella limi TaxID=2707351 RepID=UPI00194330FB|nr:aminopeptidase [Wenzhouxiangella limi]